MRARENLSLEMPQLLEYLLQLWTGIGSLITVKVGLALVRIFLNLSNHPLPMCLSCGEFAFFVPSCWLACLSFALAPIGLSPDYTVCLVDY